MRTTLAGLALALVAVLGPNAEAQAPKSNTDRDAGKQETVRGVIAGVTVAGEMAIDYATHRAQSAEMTYMTIVGSPARGSTSQASREKDADKDRDGERRHNVYVVWLSPQTQVRDATDREGDREKGRANEDAGARGKPASIDQLQIGDQVRVTFTRREFSRSGGGNQQQMRKHGRHRTYFGDATMITILAEPDRDRDRDGNRSSSNDRNRDDDKDKVKDRSKDNK